MNPILTVFDDNGNAIPIPAFPWPVSGGSGGGGGVCGMAAFDAGTVLVINMERNVICISTFEEVG